MLDYVTRYNKGLFMTTAKTSARQRLVAAAADMISRRGLNATSIRELAKFAKAPLGSTYHYFPGGKKQVATEAVQLAGDTVTQALTEALDAGPVNGIRSFLNLWRNIVIKSEFRAGCPVVSVATEEPVDEEGEAALAVAANIFSTWEQVLQTSLRQHGAKKRAAEQLATLIVAAVEGSIALCRAKRSIKPLDEIAEQLEALVKQAMGNK